MVHFSLPILAGTGAYLSLTRKDTSCAQVNDISLLAGARRKDLPNFHRAQIEAHKGQNGSPIWVTYKDGVYDITEFVKGHPGGDKIFLAAGTDVEPFWDLYAVHKSSHVFEQLEELRIGNVHPSDKFKTEVRNPNDPFTNEPRRHPALRVNSPKPFNSEPPPELLVDNFITPNELFFIRNHLPVPNVNDANFELKIEGEGIRKPISLKISDLKRKFKVHTITATVQCAGNRRTHMAQHKPVKGLSWGMSAISNAEWTGVKLADVLAHAGVNLENVHHVIFQGLDKDLEGMPYEASIPAETALDPNRDVMLAFEMNEKPLPRDHGYPLRVVVPGTIGARQVKWVSKIITSKHESGSHWQQKDYKSFNPSVDWHNADYDQAIPIQEYPVQSAICDPLEGAILEDSEEVTVKGYSWSGGGRGIVRVDISVDSGKTWHEAELHHLMQKPHRQWAWTLFEVTVPIPKEHPKDRKLTIICKATDSSHNCQPETVQGTWNMRGLIHNAWHRVHVTLPPE